MAGEGISTRRRGFSPQRVVGLQRFNALMKQDNDFTALLKLETGNMYDLILHIKLNYIKKIQYDIKLIEFKIRNYS